MPLATRGRPAWEQSRKKDSANISMAKMQLEGSRRQEGQTSVLGMTSETAFYDLDALRDNLSTPFFQSDDESFKFTSVQQLFMQPHQIFLFENGKRCAEDKPGDQCHFPESPASCRTVRFESFRKAVSKADGEASFAKPGTDPCSADASTEDDSSSMTSQTTSPSPHNSAMFPPLASFQPMTQQLLEDHQIGCITPQRASSGDDYEQRYCSNFGAMQKTSVTTTSGSARGSFGSDYEKRNWSNFAAMQERPVTPSVSPIATGTFRSAATMASQAPRSSQLGSAGSSPKSTFLPDDDIWGALGILPKSTFGDWAVYEDHAGEYYVKVSTKQRFDQPTAELVQSYRACKEAGLVLP